MSVELRIKYASECTDTQCIERVKDAGLVFSDYQLMFNGVKVAKDGYCGEWMTELISKSNGFHEPQEEYAFYEVLKRITDGSSMLEVGCYWAWYSMWFNKDVKNAKNYLIDCDQNYLDVGINNFNLNNMVGEFELNCVPNFTMEYFFEKYKLDFLNILHSDIQGFEMDLLNSCKPFMDRIGYIFISTHSDSLHEQVIDLITSSSFTILCENNLRQSCSVDGFVVAKNPHIDKDFKQIKITKGNYTY
jgi:hypothetical protein